MATSSILWQNDRKTVILLDLVRSIEEAQIPSSELAANDGRPPATLRRLVSALPPTSPFPTPEPKGGSSDPPVTSPSAQIAELMTQAAVESALEEIRASHGGPWCLPRVTSPKEKPTKKESPSARSGSHANTFDSNNNNNSNSNSNNGLIIVPPATATPAAVTGRRRRCLSQPVRPPGRQDLKGPGEIHEVELVMQGKENLNWLISCHCGRLTGHLWQREGVQLREKGWKTRSRP
ncbi:hypothetical protein VTH06DRAFT_3026 [Thermothelomyces fergusii]